MSQLVGAAMPSFWFACDDDVRSHLHKPLVQMPERDGVLTVDVDVMPGRARTIIQPFLPSGLYGDQSLDIGALDAVVWIKSPPHPSGANGRLGFNGFTRDASGGVITGVTVKCMLTATDTKQSEAVSDADGVFVVSTAEAGGHYLIFYKTGTPDISGTTVNTLLGA